MSEQDTSLVPGREHYSLSYLSGGRVFSYAHQINSVLEFAPTSVLEIGVGTGMVAASLKSTGIQVTTVDVQPELQPDIIASVEEIPLLDNAVDVALCCQVLEHLPYESFNIALAELLRVTRKGMLLSLPDATRAWHVRAKLPLLGTAQLWPAWPLVRTLPMPPDLKERHGHHWEIGFGTFDIQKIRHDISKVGWTIQRDWRVPELTYHRFFSLVPQNATSGILE